MNKGVEMKILAVVLSLVAISVLAQEKGDQAPPRQSSPDYDDGEAFEPQAREPGKPVRNPAADLPYSDDEIQHNLPENYPTKNMPVDQD